ncbi:hypothetical protein [Paenibacillus piri]|uniref:hypothetical protein n=1 Tax=Paenibacillus piri TaxID=2547395 RepID=UPI001404C21F|nr:hypothetical protein [Paenibacillus piri]
MGNKLIIAAILLALSYFGIRQPEFVIVNPFPADPFEYEFDLLNGQVAVNPYGASK